MAVIYTVVGLGETFVFLASAIAVAFVIARAIFRFTFARKDATHRVPPKEEMLHLKRADSHMGG